MITKWLILKKSVKQLYPRSDTAGNSVYDEIAGFQIKECLFFTKFVFGSRKYSAPFSATSHTRETLSRALPLRQENLLQLEFSAQIEILRIKIFSILTLK